MKASDLKKIGWTLGDVLEQIETSNRHKQFKMCIPHFERISNDVILQLIDKGFKVYRGAWDNITIDATIIEW